MDSWNLQHRVTCFAEEKRNSQNLSSTNQVIQVIQGRCDWWNGEAAIYSASGIPVASVWRVSLLYVCSLFIVVVVIVDVYVVVFFFTSVSVFFVLEGVFATLHVHIVDVLCIDQLALFTF